MKGANAMDMKLRTSRKLTCQIIQRLATKMKVSCWQIVTKKFNLGSLSITAMYITNWSFVDLEVLSILITKLVAMAIVIRRQNIFLGKSKAKILLVIMSGFPEKVR